MQTLKKKWTEYLATQRDNGFLHVAYALLYEGILLGFLGFIALFTAETLLPTFVTVRISLAGYMAILVFLTLSLAWLGKFLDLSFSINFSFWNPWVILGIVWTSALLVISLYKFPPVFIPLLVIGFGLVGWLFSHVLFDESESE